MPATSSSSPMFHSDDGSFLLPSHKAGRAIPDPRFKYNAPSYMDFPRVHAGTPCASTSASISKTPRADQDQDYFTNRLDSPSSMARELASSSSAQRMAVPCSDDLLDFLKPSEDPDDTCASYALRSAARSTTALWPPPSTGGGSCRQYTAAPSAASEHTMAGDQIGATVSEAAGKDAADAPQADMTTTSRSRQLRTRRQCAIPSSSSAVLASSPLRQVVSAYHYQQSNTAAWPSEIQNPTIPSPSSEQQRSRHHHFNQHQPQRLHFNSPGELDQNQHSKRAYKGTSPKNTLAREFDADATTHGPLSPARFESPSVRAAGITGTQLRRGSSVVRVYHQSPAKILNMSPCGKLPEIFSDVSNQEMGDGHFKSTSTSSTQQQTVPTVVWHQNSLNRQTVACLSPILNTVDERISTTRMLGKTKRPLSPEQAPLPNDYVEDSGRRSSISSAGAARLGITVARPFHFQTASRVRLVSSSSSSVSSSSSSSSLFLHSNSNPIVNLNLNSNSNSNSNANANSNGNRPQRQSKQRSPYVPLAQGVLNFARSARDFAVSTATRRVPAGEGSKTHVGRGRDKSASSEFVEKKRRNAAEVASRPVKFTVPHSPVLLTKHRARALPLSYDEQIDHEMQLAGQMRHRAVPSVASTALAVPNPNASGGELKGGHNLAAPSSSSGGGRTKTIKRRAPTVPISPAITKVAPKQPNLASQALSLQRPLVLKYPRGPTVAEPFDLPGAEIEMRKRQAFESRLQEERMEQVEQREFHAQPPPWYLGTTSGANATRRRQVHDNNKKVRGVGVGAGVVVQEEEDGTAADENHHPLYESFRAHPIPRTNYEPFVARHSERPTTESDPVHLATETRAIERRVFDDHVAALVDERAALQRAQEQREEAEWRQRQRQVRMSLVHRARPMPQGDHGELAASVLDEQRRRRQAVAPAATAAVSPLVLRRSRAHAARMVRTGHVGARRRLF